MPDVVDLATLRNKQESKAQDIPAAAPESGDAQSPEKQPVQTALLIIKNTDGNWQATPDLSIAALIEPQAVPDGQDLIAGLNVVLSDIQAEKTSNMTAMFMQQMAQQQMAAMQNAQIAAGLNLPKH